MERFWVPSTEKWELQSWDNSREEFPTCTVSEHFVVFHNLMQQVKHFIELF